MKIVVAIALCGLAACAQQEDSFPKLASIEKQACPAPAIQTLVGADRSAAVGYEYTPKRVIDPTTAVTRDYVRNRLNFRIDDQGYITGIFCG